MHKNPQRRKTICGMHPTGRKDGLIDLKMVFVEYTMYPVCVISVAVLVPVVKRPLFLLVFVVLYNRRIFYFSKL